MRVEDQKLLNINGGESGIGTTFLTHLSTVFKTVYGIGQGFGGAIRRIATDDICPTS